MRRAARSRAARSSCSTTSTTAALVASTACAELVPAAASGSCSCEGDIREPHDLDRAFAARRRRRGRALRRAEGGRRIGRDAAALLRQQRRRHGAAARRDGAPRRARPGVLVVVHGVRRARRRCRSPRTARSARRARTAAPSCTSRRCCATSPPPAGWRIALLRYFNPVGAHPSGLIGEDPIGIPNNLMPYIMQVAVGRRDHLTVLGDDYPTPDGTCVRDYLHVVDLAEGHLAALDHLDAIDGRGAGEPRHRHRQLGARRRRAPRRGRGSRPPVRGRTSPRRVTWSRCGPIPRRATSLLHWRAAPARSHDMCADHWRWQSETPTATAAEGARWNGI